MTIYCVAKVSPGFIFTAKEYYALSSSTFSPPTSHFRSASHNSRLIPLTSFLEARNVDPPRSCQLVRRADISLVRSKAVQSPIITTPEGCFSP